MNLLLLVVHKLIDSDPKSCSVRDKLTEHLSITTGVSVSHKRTNKLLTEMVDAGKLYRVQIGTMQYYAYDPTKQLRRVVDKTFEED